MFSTPLIWSSIGETTVAATISALAPGYWPVTLITGGAMSGYCATGSREKLTAPTITKMIDTTAAKIGRSIKKCEMRIARVPRLVRFRGRRAVLRGRLSGRRRRRALFHRRHLDAGTRAHKPVHDHAVVGVESFHHAHIALQRAERDVFLLHRIVAVDDENELADLLAADGGIRNQQRIVFRRARHPHAREHARREEPVGIFNESPAANGTRRLIDHVVDEVDLAMVHEVLLVEELQCHRCRRVTGFGI